MFYFDTWTLLRMVAGRLAIMAVVAGVLALAVVGAVALLGGYP